jgi:hypothetical protein
VTGGDTHHYTTEDHNLMVRKEQQKNLSLKDEFLLSFSILQFTIYKVATFEHSINQHMKKNIFAAVLDL